MARTCLGCATRYRAPARTCPACGSDQSLIIADPAPDVIDGVASVSAQLPLAALILASATAGAPGLVLGTILTTAGGLGACLILPLDAARVVRSIVPLVAIAYAAFACLSQQWLFTAIPAAHALVVIVMLGSDQSRRSVRWAVLVGWLLVAIVLGLTFSARWWTPPGWWNGETLSGLHMRGAAPLEAELDGAPSSAP